jgi:hypothetical protein
MLMISVPLYGLLIPTVTQVLAEVPRQVVDYMQSKGIAPGQRTIVPAGQTLGQVMQNAQSSFIQQQASLRSGGMQNMINSLNASDAANNNEYGQQHVMPSSAPPRDSRPPPYTPSM